MLRRQEWMLVGHFLKWELEDTVRCIVSGENIQNSDHCSIFSCYVQHDDRFVPCIVSNHNGPCFPGVREIQHPYQRNHHQRIWFCIAQTRDWTVLLPLLKMLVSRLKVVWIMWHGS